MAKVKVFVTDGRTDRRMNEIQCPCAFAKAGDNKGFTSGVSMPNMKSLSFYFPELLERLKFPATDKG